MLFLIMFFINEVFADGVTSSVGTTTFQSFTASLVPLLIFVAIFYFLLIRPQQKKQRDHEKEVSSLKPNDKILTAGGIYGVIKKVKEKSLIIEIADGVEIEVISETVTLARDLIDKGSTNAASSKKETQKKNEKISSSNKGNK